MARVPNDKQDVFVSPALRQLNDKDRVSIYNLGVLKSLNTGQFLFEEGDSDGTAFLVVKGSLRIAKNLEGQPIDIGTLCRGDWTSGGFSDERLGKPASAIALEPSTVLAFSETALNSLPPSIVLVVYKDIYQASVRQTSTFVKKATASSRPVERLSAYIRNCIETRSEGYNRSDMIQGIVKSVPRLPRYATDLASRLLDEGISTQEVIDLARADPSLAGVILKTVNSGYYNFSKKISDVRHSIMLLGFQQVHQLVLADGMRKTMPDNPEFHELHVHSLLISHIAFEICVLFDMQKAATLSTVGLLHDVGKSVILLLKKKYPKLDMLMAALDHAKIGSLLLKEWNIPDSVCQIVGYQSYPEFCPPSDIPGECRKDVAILYVSHCCYDYLRRKSKNDLPDAFLNEYLPLLGSSDKSISALVRVRLLPLFNKKKNTLPQAVQQFLRGNTLGV